jgi:hypothetical protein
MKEGYQANAKLHSLYNYISSGVEGIPEEELKDIILMSVHFEIINEILYRKIILKNKEVALKIVPPESLQNELIKQNHDNIFSAHMGVRRTYDKISAAYYWPGMYESVLKYVLACTSCQKRKGYVKRNVGSPGNIIVTRPNQQLGVDLHGPLPVTASGFQHILVPY